MKIVGVIPARYNSSRFPGKPLVDILGKPMIWWVYNRLSSSKIFNELIIATDDDRIALCCKEYEMNYVMTSKDCGTSTERLYEVSIKVESDIYVCINGDEPLIDPNIVKQVIPDEKNNFFVANLMTKIKDPIEAIDSSNIKVVTDKDGYALLMSRGIIPYPKKSICYNLYKHVGVLSYTKEALSFFANTLKGDLEKIEDINELRFIENGKKIKMIKVNSNTLSVDTESDLEKVREIIEKKIKKGDII